MRYVYPADITPDEDNGGYSATFPGVYGASTCGSTIEEALEMAGDCLVASLGAHYRTRKDIPLPGLVGPGQYGIPLQPVVAAKVALNVAMREQGITRAALGERLGIGETAARKLCNPDHQSHIKFIDRALRLLGRQLVVEDLSVPE